MGNSFQTGPVTTPTAIESANDPRPIAIVNDTKLRQLEQNAPASGLPKYASITPTVVEGRQRHKIRFYPTPAQFATIEYRQKLIPDPISEDQPWPMGGRMFAETILQSCLAVAEQRETRQAGPMKEEYLRRLSAAILIDRQQIAEEEEMWSLTNPPDDLSVDNDYLKRVVGRKMGFGPQPAGWNHSQLEQVNEVVRIGLRRFYTPPVLDGDQEAWQWSFLKKRHPFDTIAGQYVYDLPEDYAMIDGVITFSSDESVLYPAIKKMPIHVLRSKRQDNQFTTRPEIYAIYPSNPDGNGTTYKIEFWPTPDAAYGLEMSYKTNPGLLATGVSEPAGGMPHAQTILESCLLAADEMMGNERSVHYSRFMQAIRTSVSHDQQAHAPDSVGMPVEGARDEYHLDYRHHQANVVTYEGNEY